MAQVSVFNINGLAIFFFVLVGSFPLLATQSTHTDKMSKEKAYQILACSSTATDDEITKKHTRKKQFCGILIKTQAIELRQKKNSRK